MSSTLICVTQNPELAYFIFIYSFIYLFIYLSMANARMRRLVCTFVFSQTPTTLATFFMFHSVGQVESAHMHNLSIASTGGLYKMII